MNLGDVLFPTDFSRASERAGLLAGEMTREWGTELHIVHVVPPVTNPGASSDLLRHLAARLDESPRVQTALLSGRVAHQIVQYARDKSIGIIVLGTHGRTGVSHAILGSVAESVVRRAPCPVLTVPAAGGAETSPTRAIEPALAHTCIVCARATEDLVCEDCRTRIRAEALERKTGAERPGRRGSSV
jgi:universal stress protein A